MSKTRKIIYSAIIIASIIMCLTGCTENNRVNNWGGEMTVDLPEGQKLEEITWKVDDNNDAHLWYLTRPMHEDEFPETHVFQEKSSWGIWEGTVTIIEH